MGPEKMASPPCDIGWNYVVTNSIKEDGRAPVWCIAFNGVDQTHGDYFASCCSTRVTVYKLQAGGGIEVVQAYVDGNDDEEFFACKFTRHERTGAPTLLAAGKSGILKVINCHLGDLHWAAEGHGDAINDIALLASKPSIVVTASRDHSLRLWNVQSKVCLLVMGGCDGHRNEVLTVDFHPFEGYRLASGGMDSMIKIWDLSDWANEMEESCRVDSGDGTHIWRTGRQSITAFSTDQAHGNYVDCVRLLPKDLVLSKSVANEIVLWRPYPQAKDSVNRNGLIDLIAVYYLEDCAVWFIRFALDKTFSRLACGTNNGAVLVFNLQKPGHPESKISRRATPGSTKCTVRQTAISQDGKTILGCCEDGTIWRWDVNGSPLAYPMETRAKLPGARGRGRGRGRRGRTRG